MVRKTPQPDARKANDEAIPTAAESQHRHAAGAADHFRHFIGVHTELLSAPAAINPDRPMPCGVYRDVFPLPRAAVIFLSSESIAGRDQALRDLGLET